LTTAADPVVAAMREEITALDIRLVETINARLRTVEKLRRYKAQHGIALFDPDRESWLLEHLTRTNNGPLSEGGLQELVEFVLGLVKRELADA